MECNNSYIINKLFSVPYIDRMIQKDYIPDSFKHCIKRYGSLRI